MRLSLRVFVVLFSVCCVFQASSQGFKGDRTFANKQLDSTFFLYKQQLKEAQNTGVSSDIGRKHWQLGEFYFNVGVYSEGMENFRNALEYLEGSSNDTLRILVTNSMGKIELSLKNYDLAIAYFVEANNESKKEGYMRGQAISKGFLGSCYEKKGEYENALKYQNESLKQFELINDSEGLSLVNENIGSIYEDLENYDLAQKYFAKAYGYVKNANNDREANIFNNLGDVHRKQGGYEKGLLYTQKSLDVARAINDNHQLESAHMDLSKTYSLIGDYKKAFFHLREAERINEKIFYAQNTNQLNVLHAVYDANKKEARIKLLMQENEIKSARQDTLLTILVSSVIVLGGVFFFLRKKRKEKIRIQEYRERILQAELEKKAIEEENLQKEVQLKTSALSKYSLHLSQKNKVLYGISATLTKLAGRKNMNISEKLKGLAKEIDLDLKQDKEWDEFVHFFSDIHPSFIKNLSASSNGNLSPAELRLGMLLRLNLSSKEIASVLRVTPDSIRVARHRLRKKLDLDHKEELVHFLMGL